MSSKGKGTQGYRYYMSLLSGLCRGPVEVVEINVGDKPAWNGTATGGQVYQLDAPNLFGGDDKEGGIQGLFEVYPGDADQVLPGPQGSLPGVRESIGGLVSQMRGVTTLWFDGLVSAMNPYLKTWRFRVRRSTQGWHNDTPWYPVKARVVLGGSTIVVSTNRPNDLAVTTSADGTEFTIAFSRNVRAGDAVTINGVTINYVEKDADDLEIVPNKNRERSVRNIANYVNARSTQFKATATYTATTATFRANVEAQQIHAMNASHIIWQCYTDPAWGRGLPWSDLDEDSFVRAANTLCDEGFGVALIWYRKEDIDVFIKKVCDLVGGVTYTDRTTGKIVFNLTRADYDPATVPLFTPETGLLDITDDDSASADNSYNEIIGTSRDPVTNLDFQVRAQNLAGFQAQQAVSSLDQDYKGIPTKALLQRVVLRDLRAMAAGLKKYNVTLDRRAWRIAPGSVIRISHPARNLSNVILRVGEIDDGNMIDGRIRIKAAIDVFGLPATSFAGTVDSGWIAPSRVAVPALDERLIEASYRDLYRLRGPSDAAAADPHAAFIGQLAVAPNATSLEYTLLTAPDGGAYVDRGVGSFTGNAVLSDDITPLQTAFKVGSRSMFDGSNVGQAIMLDDELVRLDAIDLATGIVTVTRGVGDTLPAAHEANTVLWTVDDDLTPDGEEYVEGETVFSKVLTRTSSEVLDEALADEQEITLIARQSRPYPPADVRVDGVSIFDVREVSEEPVLTWAERNRITQGDALTGYVEATMAPEEGQTYTIRIYDGTGEEPIRTVEDVAGTTWTYTDAMLTEDNPTSSRIRVAIESVRDGISSWQHADFSIALKAGWGYGWGTNWGSPA